MKFADRVPFRSSRFDAPATLIGLSRSPVRPVCHHTIITSTVSETLPGLHQAGAGAARYASPLVRIAHTIRAILLASATATTSGGRLAKSPEVQSAAGA